MALGAFGNEGDSLQLAEETGNGVADRVIEVLRRIGPPLAGSVLPFALVLYLALRGGGYDVIVRDEVGIAAWWIVLLGALVGVLPLARLNRPALVALGLFGAYAAWTALSMLWTESVENSFEEVARLATFGAIFVLALALQGRDGLRRTVYAVGAAIAVVSLLAVLSRLHPAWFPTNELAQSTAGQLSRLNYPLNYWNGVAAFIAMGVPLVLAMAVASKRLLTRVVATAFLPVMALAIFYTYSRTGVAVAVVGVVAFIAFDRGRLAALPALALGGLGSGLLIAAASQRESLRDGLLTETALQQGDEMMAVVVITVAGIALVGAAVDFAVRHGLGPRLSLRWVPRPSRRQAVSIAVGAVAAAGAIAIAAGAPSALGDRWEEFKSSAGAGESTARFDTASGNGRYQYWQAAIDAFESEPLTGVGAGSYEYFWLREGSVPGAIQDAHSLFFESLGELGLIGLALVLGLVGLVVVRGGLAARAAEGAKDRVLLAGAASAAIVFALASAGDWLWEITVIPIAFLMLGAAILAWRRDETRPAAESPVMSPSARLIGVAISLPLLAVIASSLLGATAMRDSQTAAAADNQDEALKRALSAQDVQPFAATPYMQEAMIRLRQGDPEAAIVPARIATQKEPTNWRTWYTAWEIEDQRFNLVANTDGTPEALAERARQAGVVRETYEQAASLNPRSGLFAASEGASE